MAPATLAAATPIADALRREEAPVSPLHPYPCPRGWVVLTGSPSATPHCLPHAQAYPIAVDAGGIAERAVTAQACPARLALTPAHGAASPVCRGEAGRAQSSLQPWLPTCRGGPGGAERRGTAISSSLSSKIFPPSVPLHPTFHFPLCSQSGHPKTQIQSCGSPV